MQFVNFKLFKDIGLDYPPPEENFDVPFFGFNSLNIKQLQEKAQEKILGNNNEENNNKDSKEKITDEINIESKEWTKISKITEENKKLKNLFKNIIFFISREVPLEISAFNEDDKRITHYIVDRPPNGINFKPNKEYVQPQWIFDCLNKKMILPVSNYAPGKKLPPHLSPYYEVNEKGEYVYEIDNEEEIKIDDKGNKEENKNEGLTKEDKELREMMLSNNKKKLLQKIRDEALKKKKTKVKVSKTTNVNVSSKEKIRKDSKNKNKDDKDKE